MSKSKRPASTGGAGPAIAESKRGSQRKVTEHAVFQPHAGGIDIGAREIYVAVPSDRDEHPVRKCGTFTSDLDQMAEWLVSCGITTVAMESTGVYWIPLYDILEQHGVTPISVYLMRKRFRLDSASRLAILGQFERVFTNPFAGSIAAQTSRNMYSISRHLLRRGIQFVSSGGKLFRGPDHALDEQTRKQLSV